MNRPKREGIMLCYPTEEGRVSRLAHNGQFLMQPKYNGERCRVEWFHNEPVLISSYGHEFKFLQHINTVLKELDPEDQLPFDGELYVHGMPREEIHSRVSATRVQGHPKAEEIQFHIFDIQDEKHSQLSRIISLTELYTRNFKDKYQIQLVPTEIQVVDGWIKRAVDYVNQGYEGAILRDPSACYVPKRSVALLKFKPTETDEYIISHVNEAISIEGEPKEMVGSFVVSGDDGTLFSVGAGKLSHKEREDLWRRREEIVGAMLLVKHEKLTTVSGVPIAAVAVKIL